jgi:two-component system, cell cycle response regulator DivK
MNRDMLTRRLERKGYEVATTDDGLTGISLRPSRGSFDLILIDMSLPK